MDAFSTYSTQAATTASPAQLVLMLYDGALARVAVAEQALGQEPADGEAAHRALTRVQAIVDELTVVLDHEQGGEVAANLADLYQYCAEALIEANLRKDPAPLASVTSVLQGLRDAWERACVLGTVTVEVAG